MGDQTFETRVHVSQLPGEQRHVGTKHVAVSWTHSSELSLDSCEKSGERYWDDLLEAGEACRYVLAESAAAEADEVRRSETIETAEI